jgi:hypothetical protein
VQSVLLLHEWQDVQSRRNVLAACPDYVIFEWGLMGWGWGWVRTGAVGATMAFLAARAIGVAVVAWRSRFLRQIC